MRILNRTAIVAVAATIACAMPLGVAAAASPFGSIDFGSSGPTTEEPNTEPGTEPGTGETETPIPSGPTVTLSKSTGIAAAGEIITVSGTGFSGAGSGIYVGLIQDSQYSPTVAGAWMTTEWLKATDIVGGAWTASIDIAAIKGASDCLVNTCSIYTVAAHGSTDRTQDTQSPVTFATPVVTAAFVGVSI